jgi:replicative DNA helicase
LTRFENIILRNLIYNDEYLRKVLPYIQENYFRQSHERALVGYISEFIRKYKKPPTKDALMVSAENDSNLHEETFTELVGVLNEIESQTEKPDQQWLLDSTESFCRERAMSNAAFLAVSILEGKEKKLDKGSIPKLFESALAVSFDSNIGHDFIDDAQERWEFLHNTTFKIPFDLKTLNEATKGGVEKATLNVLMAGPHAGKTLAMCHFASYYLTSGKNVLYITLEMRAEKIAYRIDQNLMNITADDLDVLSLPMFLGKIDKLKTQTIGKLKIKEYPAGSVHVNNFRALLTELQNKQNFKPDVIIVDYLNLCASSRLKMSENTYSYVKSISEEIRALSQEYDIPIWSATQLNREGADSSDPGMSHTSESFGLPATVDLLWALVRNKELDKVGQIMVKQIKNRYRDLSDMPKFFIGMDRTRMRWYEIDPNSKQNKPIGDGPIDEDDDSDEQAEKLAISKKYGSQAYESAYKNIHGARSMGPRNFNKTKFKDFKV